MTCTACLPRHRRPCKFLFLIADAVYHFYTVLGWAYIIHIGEYTTVAYMQVQVVAVVVVVRGCENSFTGYLRGMCRISNVSRISIVWRPCILCTYTRVIHAFGEFYIHFFSTYLWRIADDGAAVRYTYVCVRYVLGGRPLLS